ncbi:hypothetical protein PTKIN_Ptkin17bG0039400 [Pterospermum kingtungense]
MAPPPPPPAVTVDWSLNIYEAKANDASSNAAGGGDHDVIDIRIRLRYQLCIGAYGFEKLIDDVETPEFCTPFSMPLAEVSVAHVSNMLESLDVDANGCEYLSPLIAEYAVDVAKHHEAVEGTSKTAATTVVAEVGITKVDVISEEEFDRISERLWGFD